MIDATQQETTGWDCHVHLFDAQAVTLGGHYQPANASLPDIENLAQAHGVHHLVLVQPSVYGSDNSLLLKALHQSAGRHRGVVVLDAVPQDLQPLHALGVRGLRLNLVSPVGRVVSPQTLLSALAPQMHALNWHVQCYARAEDLPSLLPLQDSSGLPFVLDHLAGLHAQLPANHPAWSAAQTLAAQGAWVKLSGWYRLQATPPYSALHGHIKRLAGMFGERMVWGSDWPHTSFVRAQAPAYASMWQPVHEALRAAAVLRTAPAELYR